MSRGKIVAQSGYIQYELHTLGWKAFQDLCATILSEVLGQTFETFSPGNDGGRDGAFRGKWRRQGYDTLKGSFTAQCKFTSRKDKRINLSVLASDVKAARRLLKLGLADNYLLMTNYKISATVEESLCKTFMAAGVRKFLAFGVEKISQFITESPRLRRLVPRVYGLGDLSQILDDRLLSQTKELLLSLQDDLFKFVPTSAYRRSIKALSKYGFVLLLGEPSAGKSTTAAALALSSADEWSCSPFKIQYAEDLKDHWNPNDPRQFFWVDDAFGATQYQPNLAHEWNQIFPLMRAAINKGARVVFTSRDYIYRRAIADLKETAFPLLYESQVIINIEDLTIFERQEILYNHVKGGDQPWSFRRAIKPLLDDIAANRRFQPEIARRLGTKVFTKNLTLTQEGVRSFVENPEEFLLSVLRGLGPNEQAVLALILKRGGALTSPIKFIKGDIQVITRIGGTRRGVIEVLQAMRDSLVKLQGTDVRFGTTALTPYSEAPEKEWVIRHPTIADALLTLLVQNEELLDIYLRCVPPKRLIKEVACSSVASEDIKVVVPPSRHRLLLKRLDELPKSSEVARLVNIFLAERCSKQLLQSYIDLHQDVLERIARPTSPLRAASEVNLLMRLDKENLLPSKYRHVFISVLKEEAVDTPDADFLIVGRIRDYLMKEEIEDILKAVKERLLPKLDEKVEMWELYASFEQDPVGYFRPLIDALWAYRLEFSDDQDALGTIVQAEVKIQEAVAKLIRVISKRNRATKNPRRYVFSWKPRSKQAVEVASVQRSVFDDIDS